MYGSKHGLHILTRMEKATSFALLYHPLVIAQLAVFLSQSRNLVKIA